MAKHWMWQKPKVEQSEPLNPVHNIQAYQELSVPIKIFNFFLYHKEKTMIFIIGLILGAWLL